MSLILLPLIGAVLAVPLPLSKHDRWSQVCCKDNDINSNGGISFREFTEFVLNLMNLSRSELERLFLAGDVDRNSELDGEECIPMRKLLKSTLNEKAELLFEKYDTNGDHNLMVDEVNILASNEFEVMPNDTQKIFRLSDKDDDGIIGAGEEMSDLTLKLRTQAIVNAGRILSVFDRNHDGKVSYEEIKPEILHSTDGFTLKQLFKSIDFDKDNYLTVLEYLALFHELKIHKDQHLSSTPQTIDMGMSKINSMPIVNTGRKSGMAEAFQEAINGNTASADPGNKVTTATWPTAIAAAEIKIRDRRNVGREMTRLAPTRTTNELSLEDKPALEIKMIDTGTTEDKRANERVEMVQMVESGSMKRIKREENDDDDKAPEQADATMVLQKHQMALLSERLQNNLSGGGRSPSIDLSVTVPYDSVDFQ